MNRSELVSKLELVSRALADQDIIPIFKCFAFTGKEVIACNDALVITAPCITKEAFCVNGVTLLGLLKNSHSEEVEFTFGDGNDLVVKTGRSTFKLPWFPMGDFLWTEPDDKFTADITINEELLSGLSACLLTASKDQTQAALMGIFTTDKNRKLHLYSTDGDAISRYQVSTTFGTAKGSFGHLLPNTFCETLIKLFQEGQLRLSQEWAMATHADWFIYGRLIVSDNPINYEDWIKKTIKTPPQFIALPKGFDHALSRARVIADPESAKTVMTVEASRVKLLTETAMGVVRDTLAFGKHPEVVAAVSAELMQRCASLCSEMAVFENCCCFRSQDKLFILTSNMG